MVSPRNGSAVIKFVTERRKKGNVRTRKLGSYALTTRHLSYWRQRCCLAGLSQCLRKLVPILLCTVQEGLELTLSRQRIPCTSQVSCLLLLMIRLHYCCTKYIVYYSKIKLHSSCEIEDFVETRLLQAVCDTPIARVAGCVSSLRIQVGDSP